MIVGLTIRNFRSIREIVDLPLRDFHVLVGPNGSGKTTFLDAIDFVRDCLVMGPAGAVEARNINDFNDLTWMRRGGAVEIAVWLKLGPQGSDLPEFLLKYRILVDQNATDGVFIRDEELLRYRLIAQMPTTALQFDTRVKPSRLLGKPFLDMALFEREAGNLPVALAVGSDRLALGITPPDDKLYPTVNAVRRFLLNGIHAIRLDSQAMSLPCPVTSRSILEPDGTNLARVVGRLIVPPAGFGPHWPLPETPIAIWAEHLRYALPDLAAIGWARRQADNAEYLVVRLDSGLEVPSWLLSDGTLRMMALTIPAFLPATPAIYMVEEPENGVHPRALEIILRSLSSIPGSQCLVATHSTDVVTQCGPEPLLCFSRDANGTQVVPGRAHRMLAQWDGTPELGSVFGAGLLE